jgi:hypothetical protein
MTTGRDRLSAAYAESGADQQRLARQASAYKPELDAKAEQIRKAGDRVSPTQRIALGYHDAAKAAHEELEGKS